MGMWYTAAPLEVIAYSRPGTASTSAGREVKVRPLAMTMWMPRPMARSSALRFPSESLLSVQRRPVHIQCNACNRHRAAILLMSKELISG